MKEFTNREKKAIKLFHQGFNCAQSVMLAFSDLINIDEDNLSKISCPFGGGFCRTGGNCGTINIAVIAYSLIKGDSNKETSDKSALYKKGQKMINEFESINGSLNCNILSRNARELSKDMPKECDSIKLKPCTKFILDAITIVENELKED